MTDKEKAIVMAYTGVCMLIGDKFKIYHEYVENIMGRPVYTHEMAIKTVDDKIKEKAKTDFIALCAELEPKTGHWISTRNAENVGVLRCSICGFINEWGIDRRGKGTYNFCPNCGVRMVEPQEKKCADCNRYGKLSLDCGRCDDDYSMFEPQESEGKE